MIRLPKIIAKTLSVKLSLMVIAALATLLMVALMTMYYYSRKALKEEALQKGVQTLEATVQHIDNILLDVEQSAGNVYWKMQNYLNRPEKLDEYCRRLADNNPYILDCSIDRDTVVHQTDTVHNGIRYEYPSWTEPYKAAGHSGNIISFRLPIYTAQGKMGTFSVDVSLALLSKIVLEVKPSPNSYCTMLGKDGSYIVHPDSIKLDRNAIEFGRQIGDSSIVEAATAMVNGKKGYQRFWLNDENCYVFYKPFVRAAVPGRALSELGWSAGIIYPEDDIFGDYIRLLHTVIIIAVIGLLLLLLLCLVYIHRQFKPLHLLEKSAKRIAEGNYDESIPDTHRTDEVGRLQKHFQQMQQSLSTNVGEMNWLSNQLKERGEVLQKVYEQAQGADRMKTNFLYNMSNKMMSPASGIFTGVSTICTHYDDLTEEEVTRLVDDIQQRGGKITDLLNQLITDSEKKVTEHTDA